MDKNVKYITVSLFFVISIILAIVFLLWMSNSTGSEKQATYKVRFVGSISGLTLGSEVRYLGIPVGQVADFELIENANGVDVLIKVSSNVPISKYTVGELESLGITGLSVIELKIDSSNVQQDHMINNKGKSAIMIIRGRTSLFSRLSQNSDELMQQANQMLVRINALLTDKNISALNNTVINVENATKNLDKGLKSIHQLSEELKLSNELALKTLAQGEIVISSVNKKLIPKWVNISKNLNTTSSQLVSITSSVDMLLNSKTEHMQQLTKQGIPSMIELLESLRYTSSEIERLIDQINNNPSLLIYKQKEEGVELKP